MPTQDFNVGDSVKIVSPSFLAGRGEYGDEGIINRISETGNLAYIRLYDGPLVVNFIQELEKLN